MYVVCNEFVGLFTEKILMNLALFRTYKNGRKGMEKYQYIPLYYFTRDKESFIMMRISTMEEMKDHYKTTRKSIFLGSAQKLSLIHI